MAVPAGVVAERIRFVTFQALVTAVQDGELTLPELVERLEMLRLRVWLDRVAQSCLKVDGGSIYAVFNWERILDKEAVRGRLASDGFPFPEAAENEEAFEAVLATPEVRQAVRDMGVAVVAKVQDVENLWLRISQEVFGNANEGNPELKAVGEQSEAAKAMLLEALGKAYLGVAIERKLTELWGAAESE